MNELSTEVKAKEIHENAQFWHNRAEHNLYKFLLEVKKIRDERYYKELGFSTFEEYSEKQWNISRQTMYEKIQSAERLSEDDFVSFNLQFGHNKTLLLTRMEEPQREKTLTEGIPTEQGYKTYDEATQKEIADYKRNAEEMERKAKEYERQLETKNELISKREKENEILQSKLEDAENREPEVIERYSEPDDYEDLKYLVKRQEEILSGREEHVSKLQKEIADMKEKRSDMDKKSKEYDQLNTAINEMNGRLSDGQLRLKNQKAVYDLIRDSKKLVSDVAPLVYAIEWLDLEDNEYAQKPLREISKNLNDIAQKINQKLDEKEIIEVN